MSLTTAKIDGGYLKFMKELSDLWKVNKNIRTNLVFCFQFQYKTLLHLQHVIVISIIIIELCDRILRKSVEVQMMRKLGTDFHF